MVKKKKKIPWGQVALHTGFILICSTFILPLILMLSISFSSETAITDFGYSLWPKEFSVEGYKAIFTNPKQIIDSYRTTIIYSFLGTALGLLSGTMTAYPMSRTAVYKFHKYTKAYFFASMYFSGGLVATYILYTRWLHVDDSIWVYLIASIGAPANIYIYRSAFQSNGKELIEAGKIDGASEYRIYFSIALPLIIPTVAAYGFMSLVGRWNDWMTSMLYIRNTELYSLQYLLQKILRESSFLENLAKTGQSSQGMVVPTETMRYAMAIVASGPMMIVFPFFQKYFAKGMTVGAIKG